MGLHFYPHKPKTREHPDVHEMILPSLSWSWGEGHIMPHSIHLHLYGFKRFQPQLATRQQASKAAGFSFKMPLLEKQENSEQMLVKNETYLQILKNKDQRKRLVHEICTFLDSSQSVQEIDALRTENRKLKNANSRLRYKTKDWALKKEEYENEIERLSGEISNYLNVTNFWYEESELLNSQDKRILSEPRKHASTQTEGAFVLEKRTVETQTGEDSSSYVVEDSLSQDEFE
nr:uncharacterized protein LOC118091805 isoform X4 [Zootoca vivipara]